MEGLQRCQQGEPVRRLTTVVVMCGVGCVGAFGSTMAWADTPPPCSVQGCTYGQGAGGSTPGSPQPPSGTHRGGGGSAGPTTCTATDFTKNPPQQVTGPISSKPAFGTGGEWQYDGERTSFPRRALDFDVSSVLLDNVLGEIEP